MTPASIVLLATPDLVSMRDQAAKILREKGIGVETPDFTFKTHPNSELKPKVEGNVRKKDVFFFCGFDGNRNVAWVRMLLSINALHLASANSITLVTPYLPYLRQDRKDEPRVPISASVLIRSIETCPSVRRVITIDMHAEQLQAVFTIPTDHLPGVTIFHDWIRKEKSNPRGLLGKKLTIASADFGGAKRVRKLAERVGADVEVVLFEKKRDEDGTEVLSVIGPDVKDRVCILNDDIIDTGGSAINAGVELRERGAQRVIVTGTHLEMSPTITERIGRRGRVFGTVSAYERFAEAGLEVVGTDSLKTEPHSWLTILPLARFMAYTIYQLVSEDGSVTKLIKEGLEDGK